MTKLWDALKHSLREFFDDDCMSQAAAVAYYTIFSLPPLLMLGFYLADLAPIPQASVDRLLQNQLGVPVVDSGADGAASAESAASEDAQRQDGGQDGGLLQSVAERTREQPGVMEQFGPLSRILSGGLLIFTATGVFAQLQYGLNRVGASNRILSKAACGASY